MKHRLGTFFLVLCFVVCATFNAQEASAKSNNNSAVVSTSSTTGIKNLHKEVKMIEIESAQIYIDAKYLKQLSRGCKFYLRLQHGNKKLANSLELDFDKLLKWVVKNDYGGSYVDVPIHFHVDPLHLDNDSEIHCCLMKILPKFSLKKLLRPWQIFSKSGLRVKPKASIASREICGIKERGKIFQRFGTLGYGVDLILSPASWTKLSELPLLTKRVGRRQTYFSVMAKGLPFGVKQISEDWRYPIFAQYLYGPKDDPNPKMKMIYLLQGTTEEITLPKKDEHVVGMKAWLFKRALKATLLIKRSNRDTEFRGSRADAIHQLRHILKDTLSRVKYQDYSKIDWDDFLSDRALTRIFFSSLGQHSIECTAEGGYVADLWHMKDFEPLKGYDNFGCRAFFNKNGDIERIEEPDPSDAEKVISYKPATKDSSTEEQFRWEWIKQKLRSAVFINTSTIHLTREHYKYGSQPDAALRKHLSTDHPFRIAMSPHFYRTAFTIGVSSPLLENRGGLLARLLKMDYDNGYQKLLRYHLSKTKFKTLQEELQEKGLLNWKGDATCSFLALSAEGMELHDILAEYINDLIDEIYVDEEQLNSDEEMKDAYKYLVDKIDGIPEDYNIENVKKVWGEVLWHVTGVHSSVGNVQSWSLDPTFINMRLKRPPAKFDVNDKNFRWDLVAPQEAAIGVALVSAFATMPAPFINQDWKHIFENRTAYPEGICHAYSKLRKSLDKLEERVQKLNREREFVCTDFIPSECEISITG